MFAKIKKYFRKLEFARTYARRFSWEDWNGITAAVLSETGFKKEYQLIQGFIKRHEVSPEVELLVESSGLSYREVLETQPVATNEQLTLIHNCMIRQIPENDVIKLIKSKI